MSAVAWLAQSLVSFTRRSTSNHHGQPVTETTTSTQQATLPIPEVIPPFPKRRGSPGRPSSFNQDTADEICSRLADGFSLRAICREEWAPDFKTVFRWLQVRLNFRQQYAEARDIGLEQMADELLEIADDGSNDWMKRNDPDNEGYVFNSEHYQRSRLRVDTRKWVLSKLAPKRYGDKLDMTGAFAVTDQQSDQSTPVSIARRLAAALMRGAEQPESED